MGGWLGGKVTNEWRDGSGSRRRDCRFRGDLNRTWLWQTEGSSREEEREIRVHPRLREEESLATILALATSRISYHSPFLPAITILLPDERDRQIVQRTIQGANIEWEGWVDGWGGSGERVAGQIGSPDLVGNEREKSHGCYAG